MSDSPRTTLSHWQELQKTKCELAAAQERIAELEQACESLREDACSKILAMTDEQVKALSAFDGHNPEDEAKIGKALVETILLKKRIAELEPDAERYRWLRDTRRPTVPAGMSAHWGRSNRVPHITQYPYQKDIDDFKFPQIDHTRPETIDAAIDAAREEEGK